MGATANHAWPWPDLTPDPADGPAAFRALLEAIEQTWVDPTLTSYTPAWTGAVTAPSNPLVKAGWYRREGSWCDVGIYLGFGPGTSGGTGALTVTLPFVAANLTEQVFLIKLWVPNIGDWAGTGVVTAGSANVVSRFPTSNTNAVLQPWQGAASGAALGTGIPQIPGQYTVQNGGNYSLHGRYKVA